MLHQLLISSLSSGVISILIRIHHGGEKQCGSSFCNVFNFNSVDPDQLVTQKTTDLDDCFTKRDTVKVRVQRSGIPHLTPMVK